MKNFEVKIFWTGTQGSREKKQDIFQKKELTTKKNTEMLFEDLAWKTKLTRKTDHKKKKNNEFFSWKKEMEESKIFL